VSRVTESDRYAPLRSALAQDYRIERVLRETDAGAAYLARDLTLSRPVVVKALDPGLAGERPAAEFAREAAVLAAVSDPSIPAIHRAGSIGEFRFVVLEAPEGTTLAERLREGPLAPDDVRRMGIQVLGALEAVHAAGIAHSAVGPGTVIVGEGRYLLDGFGTAVELSKDVEREDLSAVARMLREASGGALPRYLRAVVEETLDPATRKPGAAAFRMALESAGAGRITRRRGRRAAAGAALAAGLLYTLWDGPGPPGASPRELAILPLEVDGGQTRDALGSYLAHLVQLGLEEVPGIELTPRGQVDRWWEAQQREGVAADGPGAAAALRAHWVAHGAVDRRPGDTLRLRVSLYNSSGTTRVLPELLGPAGDLAALGDSIGLGIMEILAPRSEWRHDPGTAFSGVPLPALKAFLQGEAAFGRDAWALAQRRYETALGMDSSFALADWRLANVKRWRRLTRGSDLADVYRRHAARLRTRDRVLIRALLEPDLETRFARLDTAVLRLPGDGYALLLQGEELFHLGPLAGRSVDAALTVMEDAVARDSSLALAWDHLVLGHVRAGRRDEARHALRLRRRLGGTERPDDLDLLPFLELIYDERFVPWRAWLRHRLIAWRGDARQLEDIERVARFGTPWLDLPHTQLRYCDLLLRAGPLEVETRVTAHEGKALALFALGRLEEALAQVDSAAALLDSPEARLRQAEWRVVPHVLGIPGMESSEWEARLASLTRDPAIGDRAAWALALLAAADSVRARLWRERLDVGTPLRILTDARLAAASGDLAGALAITDSARQAFQLAHVPDPFASAVYHLLRGDWLAASGEPLRAEREWLWHEATDVEGWPAGLAQPGEVNAALGTLARLKRARVLLAAGSQADSLRACRHLQRVRDLWAGASPAMQSLVDEAATLARACRP
jgi:hypothetical protein